MRMRLAAIRLQKFVLEFPQVRTGEIFTRRRTECFDCAGESPAGHSIPTLDQRSPLSVAVSLASYTPFRFSCRTSQSRGQGVSSDTLVS